jgi:DNA-binding FrmR family transcriptional regulator
VADHGAADHGKEDILRRLKSVEGHVRGVQRMVEQDEYCIDVVNQITGIQRALKKVSGLLLDHHLHACVTDAMRGPDAAARERVLGELLEVFEASGKS